MLLVLQYRAVFVLVYNNKLLFTKKDRKNMVGVQRILVVRINNCKTLNITSILICG